MRPIRSVLPFATPRCAPAAATAFTVALCAFAAAASPTPAVAQGVDYHRAELLLNWHTSPLIAGGPVAPNWINDSDRFWYRNVSHRVHILL